MQRKQEVFLVADGTCEMCNPELAIPPKHFEDNNMKGKLSSFEMWTMIFEAGVRDEIISVDREPNQDFECKLPNTLEIVRNNGGLLSIKFSTLLKENSIHFPKSGYIIYPDETESEKHKSLTEEDVPSILYIYSLRLIHGYNVLGVPRKIINEIKKDKSKIHTFKDDYPILYNELLNIENNQIIIIDEFPRTYGTYEAIVKILQSVGKSPIVYFTLFNFSPDSKDKVRDTMHLNLYEFQIN